MNASIKALAFLMAIITGLNCRKTGENTPSETHFVAAEQGLAEGHYDIAVIRLNQGIVAYRVETGKMSGIYAQRANRAIDGLIRIRKSLRKGERVPSETLHQAVMVAMASGVHPLPQTPKPDPELFQTVRGE